MSDNGTNCHFLTDTFANSFQLDAQRFLRGARDYRENFLPMTIGKPYRWPSVTFHRRNFRLNFSRWVIGKAYRWSSVKSFLC